MSDENKSRRCSFELFPDERTGDKIADELIANEKLKERGRFMRAMLVTGAAFAAIDKRLPLLISELLTENTTLDDINKVISSVIPGAFRLKRNCLNYWKTIWSPYVCGLQYSSYRAESVEK